MATVKKITKVPDGPLIKKTGEFKGSTLRNGGKASPAWQRKEGKSEVMKSQESMKNGGKAKDGKWMQKVSKSIKAKGTEGKCTPITKPGCTGKAKVLAKTFKKIAAKRKSK